MLGPKHHSNSLENHPGRCAVTYCWREACTTSTANYTETTRLHSWKGMKAISICPMVIHASISELLQNSLNILQTDKSRTIFKFCGPDQQMYGLNLHWTNCHPYACTTRAGIRITQKFPGTKQQKTGICAGKYGHLALDETADKFPIPKYQVPWSHKKK